MLGLLCAHLLAFLSLPPSFTGLAIITALAGRHRLRFTVFCLWLPLELRAVSVNSVSPQQSVYGMLELLVEAELILRVGLVYVLCHSAEQVEELNESEPFVALRVARLICHWHLAARVENLGSRRSNLEDLP